MVISIDEILERDIITNRDFADGEGLVEPEGVGVDIRIGSIWEMDKNSKAFLHKVKRKTREYNKVAEFKEGQDDKFILKPNVYYQFRSVEEVNVPSDLVGRFIARYNLLANGIMICGYKVDPGFYGKFQVPIVNLSGLDFEIELGARFAQFEFHRIDGESIKYRGQWKGGRMNMKKPEIQV